MSGKAFLNDPGLSFVFSDNRMKVSAKLFVFLLEDVHGVLQLMNHGLFAQAALLCVPTIAIPEIEEVMMIRRCVPYFEVFCILPTYPPYLPSFQLNFDIAFLRGSGASNGMAPLLSVALGHLSNHFNFTSGDWGTSGLSRCCTWTWRHTDGSVLGFIGGVH
jgi:hypothetical protein